MKHFQICEAPMCMGDPTKNWKENVIWHPGEPVCQKRPFNKVQKRQAQINRWVKKGEFKYPELCFTYRKLIHGTSLKRGRKGLNPNNNVY